ncbi:hypothetical protein [Devosia sp.]|uniref:hypothetical protein n=1 Tax=Devosia sp. TaxID=1871048 RepID=UPI002610844C|nr:hypothetical protein [Devosia sp.]
MATYGDMSIDEFKSRYLDAAHDWLIYLPFKMEVLRRLGVIANVALVPLADNACAGTVDVPASRSGSPKHFRGRTLPDGWISLDKRVAPGMLRSDGDDPYIRLAWRFSAFPCDPITGETLLNRCPSCSANLNWDTKKIESCHQCRFDLRNAPPSFADTQVLQDVRAIAGAIGLIDGVKAGPIDLPAPLGDLDLEQQLSVLQWCARLRGAVERTGTSGGPATAHMGLKIARAWPAPLLEVADLLLRQYDAGQREQYPILVEMLDGVSPHTLRDLMIEQASEAMSAAWFAVRDRYASTWRGKPRPEYMDLTAFRIRDRTN